MSGDRLKRNHGRVSGEAEAGGASTSDSDEACGRRDAGVRLADLELVDLELVDLELVDLELVDLELADLELADLELVDLELADLELADLRARLPTLVPARLASRARDISSARRKSRSSTGSLTRGGGGCIPRDCSARSTACTNVSASLERLSRVEGEEGCRSRRRCARTVREDAVAEGEDFEFFSKGLGDLGA